MAETERKRFAHQPASDLDGPSPIEKLISNLLLIAGLTMFVAIAMYGGRAFLYRSPPPKKATAVAMKETHSPASKKEKTVVAKKAETLVNNRTLTAAPHRPADHPLATEAEKAPANPAARKLLDRGWTLVAPPYSEFRWQQAGQDFEQALKIDAESSEAKIGLAYVLGAKLSDGWAPVLQENPKRAEDLLKEVLNRGDTTIRMAVAHFELGLVYQGQNRLAAAKEEFIRSIALEPKNARAHLHLGETLMYLGSPECKSFERAIRISTQKNQPLAMNYWALGTCYLISGDVDKGIAGLGKALTADDRTWVPYFYLAGAYGLKGDLDQAESALSESEKRKPALKSLARMRAENPWLGNPQYWALQEQTLNHGLREAGLPDH